MAIRKFRTGQMSYNALTYVGTAGTIFYDEETGALRLSDGVTAGGSLISYPVASPTEIGGIKLGPGVILNQDNQIIIDPEGLDFSFGDFQSTIGTYPADYYEPARQNQDYAILGSINANEDIVLATNGTGAVRVVGDFSVRRSNGSTAGALDEPPFFRVKSDGQVQMLVPTADSTEGAVTIVGSLDGVFQSPVNTGVMLHITGIDGTPGVPSRLYNDAQNAFAAFVARRYNNAAAAPSAVLANEEIMRLSGTAHNGTSIPGTANQRITFVALGNQTLTNAGGAIELWTTPINTTTLAKVATVDSTGITLESGKVLTGNVTGNATTVTNGVYTTDTGTVTNTMLAGSIANNKLANSSITVNGTSIALGGSGTVTAAAGTLTGTTLNSTVVTSSLTSVGTLTNLAIATGGTITTPRIVINDGGIRTVSGGTTCTIDFATDSIILWTAPTGTAVITLSNYTVGARVKLIMAMTTSRDITFGISSAANSSTGSDNWNGAGGGAIDIANTAVHLDYTCITALATGCYVAVTAN